MTNTTTTLANVNLLTKTQYDGIETPVDNELYAVDISTDGSIISQLGMSWLYAPENYGGGCLSIPYGSLTDKFKIQIAEITSSANSFTWTFPVAFDYFAYIVSNGSVVVTNKTLSSITVTDNNLGDSTKHSVVNLIAIGI